MGVYTECLAALQYGFIVQRNKLWLVAGLYYRGGEWRLCFTCGKNYCDPCKSVGITLQSFCACSKIYFLAIQKIKFIFIVCILVLTNVYKASLPSSSAIKNSVI